MPSIKILSISILGILLLNMGLFAQDFKIVSQDNYLAFNKDNDQYKGELNVEIKGKAEISFGLYDLNNKQQVKLHSNNSEKINVDDKVTKISFVSYQKEMPEFTNLKLGYVKDDSKKPEMLKNDKNEDVILVLGEIPKPIKMIANIENVDINSKVVSLKVEFDKPYNPIKVKVSYKLDPIDFNYRSATEHIIKHQSGYIKFTFEPMPTAKSISVKVESDEPKLESEVNQSFSQVSEVVKDDKWYKKTWGVIGIIIISLAFIGFVYYIIKNKSKIKSIITKKRVTKGQQKGKYKPSIQQSPKTITDAHDNYANNIKNNRNQVYQPTNKKKMQFDIKEEYILDESNGYMATIKTGTENKPTVTTKLNWLKYEAKKANDFTGYNIIIESKSKDFKEIDVGEIKIESGGYEPITTTIRRIPKQKESQNAKGESIQQTQTAEMQTKEKIDEVKPQAIKGKISVVGKSIDIDSLSDGFDIDFDILLSNVKEIKSEVIKEDNKVVIAVKYPQPESPQKEASIKDFVDKIKSEIRNREDIDSEIRSNLEDNLNNLLKTDNEYTIINNFTDKYIIAPYLNQTSKKDEESKQTEVKEKNINKNNYSTTESNYTDSSPTNEPNNPNILYKSIIKDLIDHIKGNSYQDYESDIQKLKDIAEIECPTIIDDSSSLNDIDYSEKNRALWGLINWGINYYPRIKDNNKNEDIWEFYKKKMSDILNISIIDKVGADYNDKDHKIIKGNSNKITRIIKPGFKFNASSIRYKGIVLVEAHVET